MTNTDLILISKDKYLHLGLCETRNDLPNILLNELIPVEEEPIQSNKNLMAYIDDRTDQQKTLKLLKNSVNRYEDIYVIVMGIKNRSGLKEVTLSEYEQQCRLQKEDYLKKNIIKYNKFHKKYNVRLTRTEKEVMSLILCEEGIPEISTTLNCSKKVIYAHKYNIMKKYGFRTFNELYIKIMQQDLD